MIAFGFMAMSNEPFELRENSCGYLQILRKYHLNIIKQNISGLLNCMVINLQFLIALPNPRIEIFEVALSSRHSEL
jgi:hypothetical protein